MRKILMLLAMAAAMTNGAVHAQTPRAAAHDRMASRDLGQAPASVQDRQTCGCTNDLTAAKPCMCEPHDCLVPSNRNSVIASPGAGSGGTGAGLAELPLPGALALCGVAFAATGTNRRRR